MRAPPLLAFKIPALAGSAFDEAEVLAKSMVANGALPPTQLEFGAAAARLKGWGWADEKIALYTPPHIAQDGTKAKRYVRIVEDTTYTDGTTPKNQLCSSIILFDKDVDSDTTTVYGR